MLSLKGKVIFCTNINSCSVQKILRHNITALKFAAKIRDGILKKQMKKTKRNFSYDGRPETSLNKSIWEV